jgi:uncharacterized low-complexity protein
MEAFSMSQESTKKPLAIALGAAFVTTLAATPVANAADNPFAMSELSSGYMVAEMAEGKCGEGKCGGDKAKSEAEGKCGEGKCGGDKAKTDAEGKCGEGKCGGEMKATEGKCGEGKCGGDKK